MPNGEILVDTWALMALVNRDDARHAQAVSLSRQLHTEARPLVITDWTLAEFLGGTIKQPLRDKAVESVQQFKASRRAEIVPASRLDWDQGFQLYVSKPDKSWSLVDCISIVICQKRGITEVFSGDAVFEEAGLKLLAAAGK